MKTYLISAVFTILIATQVNAQNYQIDASHSNVQIQVERFGVVDVIGRFKDVAGTIFFNPEDPSKTRANATIKVDSYDANNVGGEQAVKSPAFLDAATFPEMSFKSSKVMLNDEKSILVGELTIHGVTKSIELPFSVKGPLLDLPTQKQSIAFTAAITINRQDFGMSFDRKLPNGTSLVSNDVRITINVLAIAE